MANFEITVNKTVNEYTVTVDRLYGGGGSGSEMTAAQIAAKLDTFTVITPAENDYVILGGKDKTLLSAIKTLFQTAFNSVYSAIGHGHSYTSLTDKPTIPTALADLTADATHRTVTDAEKTTWNGKADLENGKVPSSQLPSFVDDVIEVANFAALPTTGESGKIYITADTNLTYRWTGSGYAEISQSLALGETSSSAYRGDRGAAAYAALHTHTNKSTLDLITEAFTTALKSAYDSAVSWIATNGANLLSNMHTHVNKSVLDLFAWNSTDSTIEFPLSPTVTLQIGQEEVLKIYNNTGSPLTDGQVVYINGSSGTRPTVALATNATEIGSENTIGIVTEPINNLAEGFVTLTGLVRAINTNAYNEGDKLYLGTGGAITNTKPIAPAHAIQVGYCIKKAGAGAGMILVKVESGFELGELHDVDTTKSKTTPVDADAILLQDSTDSSLWKRITWANFKGLFLASVAHDYSIKGSGTVADPITNNMAEWRARYGYQFFTDLIGNLSQYDSWYLQTGNNTGLLEAGTNVNGRVGIKSLQTAALNNNRTYYTSASSSAAYMNGSGAVHYFRAGVMIPTLSDGTTERFCLKAGFCGDGEAGLITQNNGSYFLYDEKNTASRGASTQWRCVSANGNVVTGTNTESGITVTAGTWYDLLVSMDATNSVAKFYINGTLVSTQNANIYTGAMTFAILLQKSDGTTKRVLNIDYFGINGDFITPRF